MHALPHVVFLDLNDLVCPRDACRAMLDGRVVFRDDHHMTASFSRSLAGLLAARMVQPGNIDASAAASGKSPMAGVPTAAVH